MSTAPALVEVRALFARGRGFPGLVQGTYGARGNLELVQADADDGLWVHWRNNDPIDLRPGAFASHWSVGLAFELGRRYDAAGIVQVTQGSPNLEVVASSDGVLFRTFWTAEAGFSSPLAIAEHVGEGSLAIVQAPNGDLIVVIPSHERGVRALRCETGTYPVLQITDSGTPPCKLGVLKGVDAMIVPNGLLIVAVSEAGEVVELQPSGSGRIASGCQAVALVPTDRHSGNAAAVLAYSGGGIAIAFRRGDGWESPRGLEIPIENVSAISACRSTVCESRIEIVARSGETIWHLAVGTLDGELREGPSAIETRAWVSPDSIDAVNAHPSEAHPCHS